MNRLMAAVLAGLVLSGCALRAVGLRPPAPSLVVDTTVDTDGVMRLFGRWGYAHACPVDGLVLTAAHVVNPFYRTLGLNTLLFGYNWSDMDGRRGYLDGYSASTRRDLGEMLVVAGEPRYYSRATSEPQPGETLWWLEYNFADIPNAFAAKREQTTLIRLVAGHLITHPEPTYGASGSCLLNSENEVVGIIVKRPKMDDGEFVGVVVSIFGPWWPR